jgi:hypothetical protein
MSKEEIVRATRLRRAALYLNGQDNGCNEIKTLRDLVEAAQAQPQPDAQTVAWLTSDGRQLVFEGVLDQSQYIEQGMRPLVHAAEVEQLRIDLELTRLARQSDQIEIDGLKALCDGFRAQLADAAQSLETISRLAGRDEFMEDMTDVRGYANSRATVARGALSAIAGPADLESRPEERGCPELEPCSGCGTPGWTAACDKCIPY